MSYGFAIKSNTKTIIPVWKYLPKWELEFLWLKNSEGGMICEVCKKNMKKSRTLQHT